MPFDIANNAKNRGSHQLQKTDRLVVRKDCLSVREIARLQGFDDDFVFWGSLGTQYRQVLDAVPPIVTKLIGAAIESVINTARLRTGSNSSVAGASNKRRRADDDSRHDRSGLMTDPS